MNLQVHLNSFLFADTRHVFIHLIYIFIGLLFLLFILIALYSVYASKRESNKKSWEEGITDLINEAIFAEDEKAFFILEKSTERLLRNAHYRQCCIDEIIKTRKGLSGTACQSLKRLYERLHLDKDSFNKLSSLGWEKKAKGIQELSSLEQAKYVKHIFRLTTHKNETVRNEAQCGLVSYFGFLGLRFLNVTLHPVSEWQQIQLINKLNISKRENTAMLLKWLRSDMESVLIFSLKLASFYNNAEVYAEVINCISHNNIKVKLQVIEYLKKMQQEGTAERLIEEYATGNKEFRLAVIDALKYTGNINHISFLLMQLNDADNEIKASAAKTLTVIHPNGNSFLQMHSYAAIAPWNTIFQQVKNELAA